MEYYEERFDKPDFWESPVYEGDVPSIVGKRIAVVRVGSKESLIYCSDKQIASLRDKYDERFVRIAGTVERDPKLPRPPRKQKYDVHGDEIDELALWADKGLEINLEEENDRLALKRKRIGVVPQEEEVYKSKKIDEQEDDSVDDEEPVSLTFDKIVSGINTLAPREFELFRLWERGFRDSVISTTLGLKLESVVVIRKRIFEKLRDYYGSDKIVDFGRLIVRLHVYARKNNKPLPSEHYAATTKSRGRYAKKPVDFSPALRGQKQLASIVDKVFADKKPEILRREVGPPEKVGLQLIEPERAEEKPDLGPANGPDEIDALSVEAQEAEVISFNRFIDSYGNRKDAVKALNEFNKLNILEKQKAFAFIPRYKESLTNITFQQSPYSYLTGRSWK